MGNVCYSWSIAMGVVMVSTGVVLGSGREARALGVLYDWRIPCCISGISIVDVEDNHFVCELAALDAWRISDHSLCIPISDVAACSED